MSSSTLHRIYTTIDTYTLNTSFNFCRIYTSFIQLLTLTHSTLVSTFDDEFQFEVLLSASMIQQDSWSWEDSKQHQIFVIKHTMPYLWPKFYSYSFLEAFFPFHSYFCCQILWLLKPQSFCVGHCQNKGPHEAKPRQAQFW